MGALAEEPEISFGQNGGNRLLPVGGILHEPALLGGPAGGSI
jgi:hypothetical protein